MLNETSITHTMTCVNSATLVTQGLSPNALAIKYARGEFFETAV